MTLAAAVTLAARAAGTSRGLTVAWHVATPVLERVGGMGVVRGTGRAATYVDFDGFVVALTAPGIPLMPNGIALVCRPDALAWARSGAPVSLVPGRLGEVGWNAECPPAWDARLCRGLRARPAQVRARGAAVLSACGVNPDRSAVALARALRACGIVGDAAAVALLLGSVASRDPTQAAAASELLIGRGPGLTPESDDLIAATAAVVSALEGWSETEREAWRAAALPCGLRSRTTSLSATLLELAGAGDVIEPVHGLFADGCEDDKAWRAALRRLLGVGGSTGAAYALGAGAAAFLGAA